jgi:hypothetical protein
MEKTFNPTYEIYYRQCLDGIMHHLSLNRLSALFALDEYESTHGEAYIIAMAGFINYAQTEKLDDFAIQSTLVHDLNGRKDKLMLPRTSDYAQYANPAQQFDYA